MDNRLDFYNDAKKYIASMNEQEDTALIITYNNNEGDAIVSFAGDENAIYSLITNPKTPVRDIESIRKLFLNTTLILLERDEELKNIFLMNVININHKFFK